MPRAEASVSSSLSAPLSLSPLSLSPALSPPSLSANEFDRLRPHHSPRTGVLA
jgi:hypothetical protein